MAEYFLAFHDHVAGRTSFSNSCTHRSPISCKLRRTAFCKIPSNLGSLLKNKNSPKDKNTITLLSQTFSVDRRLSLAKVNSILPRSKRELVLCSSSSREKIRTLRAKYYFQTFPQNCEEVEKVINRTNEKQIVSNRKRNT